MEQREGKWSKAPLERSWWIKEQAGTQKAAVLMLIADLSSIALVPLTYVKM